MGMQSAGLLVVSLTEYLAGGECESCRKKREGILK